MPDGQVQEVLNRLPGDYLLGVYPGVEKVRQFLGLVGYYCCFIPNFASTATPMMQLLTKNQPQCVNWSPECAKVFQMLKDHLCHEPVLYSPDFSRTFVIWTDASAVGLGAILSQTLNGEEHPVLYISQKLFPREHNYSTIKKEALALKWAVEALRYYLLGDSFIVVMDHAPLKWLQTMKDTNARLVRWYLALQLFALTMQHRAGRENANADGSHGWGRETIPALESWGWI
ncbi:unnamed protein product [Eretmochelys imbricata]